MEIQTQKTSKVTRYGEPQLFGSVVPSGTGRSVAIDQSQVPEIIKRGMARRAQVGSGAGNTSFDGVTGTFFSPFRIRPSLEAPTKRVDLNEWYRYYAAHDPIVGTAVELHAYFPLSKFELEHDDPALAELFNDEKELLELEELLPQMGLEWWLVGEAFPFGFLDDPDDPSRFERFILLDPDKIRINKHPLARGKHDRDYIIRMQPDADLKKIVQNGPNDPHTGELFRNIPQDIIDYVKASKTIPLHPLQVSHFRRVVNPFAVRGQSILSRVLQDLMLLDKYRDAQWAIADRHITPTEYYLIGEPGYPADEAELQDFREVLAAGWTQYNRAYVWHHAVNIQIHGANGKILPLNSEYDFLEKRILSGLMMNKAFLTGEGPTYANASVAMDVLITRYMEYRDKIERWLTKSVFEPLCRMNEIYKPTEAELSHRVRVRKQTKRPWVPRISWARPSLRDDTFKIQLYERLVNQLMLPREELYRLLNKNPTQVREGLLKQRKQDEQDRTEGAAPPGAPPTGMGLPSAPPGGGMGMPGGMGGMPPGTQRGLPTGLPGVPQLPVPGTAGPLAGGPAGTQPPPPPPTT